MTKKTRIAINGFGRIGRQVTKALKERYNKDFDLVAVNDLGDVATNAHLFKYDSNYGVYKGTVTVDGGDIVIDGTPMCQRFLGTPTRKMRPRIWAAFCETTSKEQSRQQR